MNSLFYKDVALNEYGFYSLIQKPTAEEQEKYFADMYYQQNLVSYTSTYNEDELKFFQAKLEQKHILIQRHLTHLPPNCKLLDIGCGEGFVLDYFAKVGFDVTGLDYSSAGLNNHNPHMLEKVILGDANVNIETMINEQMTFDIINMDGVLDQLPDPYACIVQVEKLLKKDGLFIVKVTNNFSVLQEYFIERNIVSKPHWVVPISHMSYFNKDGLVNLCKAVGFTNVDILGNYMTEFFILNPNTNYLEHKEVGKSCHLARVAQENILHGISPHQAIELYRVLGSMGLGREIIGIFKKS